MPDEGRVSSVTFPVTAGALVRKDVRAVLDLYGLTYREHKAWTESTFVVTGTPAAARRFAAWLDRVNAPARVQSAESVSDEGGR